MAGGGYDWTKLSVGMATTSISVSPRAPFQITLYGAAPYEPTWPDIQPQPQPIFIPPNPPSAEEIARKVAEALAGKPGKIDPPPSEATRELDAIKAIVQSIEATEAIIRAVAEQLTPEEKARVMRYIEDRYGKR